MKADYRFCFFASVAILWSLRLAGESFAQAPTVEPSRPATSARLRAAMSPDCASFAVVTAEGRITCRRTSDGVTLHTFYQCHPQALEFSPDGRLLASVGTSDGRPARIKVWNVADGTLLCRLETTGGTLVRRDESAAGREPAASSPARLAPLPDGQTLAFSPDGQWLRAARPDGETVAWSLPILRGEGNVGVTVGEPIVIKGRSAGLAFSRDGTRLTTGSSVWSALDGKLLVGTGTNARNGRPAFSPDGKYVANGLDILQARDGRRVVWIEPEFGSRKIYGVAFSPNGKQIATGKGDWEVGDVKIFAVPGGEEMKTFAGHTNPVWDVAFSPDGRFLASASGRWKVFANGGPGEARLWDVNTGVVLQIHQTPLCLYSIAFSGDGRRFAASGGAYHVAFKSPDRGEIKVWDADSGEEVFSATGLPSCIYSVALSPDGKRLVAAVGSAGESGAFDVKLWDLETGLELLTLGRHDKKVYGVAFSADGKRIASGGTEGVINIWNVE